MIRKNKPKEDRWLLTYSDMITLLLVFFILFVSIKEPKTTEAKFFLSSLVGNLGFLNSGQSVEEVDNSFVTLGNKVQNLPSENLSKLKLATDKQAATFLFKNINQTRKVRVTQNREGIVISLFTDIFFEPSSAKLNYDSVKDVLENIRKLVDIYNFSGEILINGHTDNVPYNGREFRDNWELSMARALSVFNALREIPFVYPLNTERISVHAYGENRPVESNDTPEGRSYNRRVDIFLKR